MMYMCLITFFYDTCPAFFAPFGDVVYHYMIPEIVRTRCQPHVHQMSYLFLPSPRLINLLILKLCERCEGKKADGME